MPLSVRKLPDDITYALASQYNALLGDLAVARSKFHRGVTSVTPSTAADYKAPTAPEYVMASADASSLATSIALVNEEYLVYTAHIADACAHKVADATNTVNSALYPATDLASVIALANALTTAYEAHRASTTFHYTADSTNTITSSAASNQGTANTLITEQKGDINAHIRGSTTAQALNLIDP